MLIPSYCVQRILHNSANGIPLANGHINPAVETPKPPVDVPDKAPMAPLAPPTPLAPPAPAPLPANTPNGVQFKQDYSAPPYVTLINTKSGLDQPTLPNSATPYSVPIDGLEGRMSYSTDQSIRRPNQLIQGANTDQDSGAVTRVSIFY